MTTTVLIADGEPVLRAGLTELLASQPDFAVVGEATNTNDAVDEARARHPDIALVALNLPGGGGLDTAGRIRKISPSTRLIVMVPPRHVPGLTGDADAVVSYATRADQMLSRIRATRLVHPRVNASPDPLGPDTRRPPALTPREAQVCALLARAYSNREIQMALGIRNSAVKRHVRRILFKLGAHNRIEVAIQVARSGALQQEGGQS
ncbi:MAG: response regulator transcription factor [Chloroflexi bacterium]|nr:response regulator transcription factor [Chloroflexota bacterium]